MKAIKFSIIMPTYNSEKRIRGTIDEVLRQKYDNFELIIINDGSNDGTDAQIKDVIDEYGSKIKYYSIRNSGVSHARNVGIEYATGDYLIFIDDDDHLASNALVKISEAINRTNPDLVRFGGAREKIDGSLVKISQPGMSQKNKWYSVSSLDFIDGILREKNKINCYVWLLAIKNQSGLYFDEKLSYLEDEKFYLEFLPKMKKIVVLNDVLYTYEYNGESKTKNASNFLTNIEDILKARNAVEELSIFGDKDVKKRYEVTIVHLLFERIKFYRRILDKENYKRSKKEVSFIIRKAKLKIGIGSSLRMKIQKFLICMPYAWVDYAIERMR